MKFLVLVLMILPLSLVSEPDGSGLIFGAAGGVLVMSALVDVLVLSVAAWVLAVDSLPNPVVRHRRMVFVAVVVVAAISAVGRSVELVF